MWIRSQRRNTLVNINFMRVINDGNYCLICGATTDGCDCELGAYSTKEKTYEAHYFDLKGCHPHILSIKEILAIQKQIDELGGEFTYDC